MKVFSATIFTILYSSSIASARLQTPRKLRPTPMNVDSPGGICTSDFDCQATLRTQTPSYQNVIGPDLCDCYGISTLNPFDECQGVSRGCAIAGCEYNQCEGYEAYCHLASNGIGRCDIRLMQANVDKPGGTCSRDSDCQATLRTQTPVNTVTIGPDMCDCYGVSHQLPFDECQGEGNCPIAGCGYDQCEGYEAYCQRVSDGSGECAIRPIQANVDKPGGTCSRDSDCYTTVRSQAPRNPTGPNRCDCYGASHQLPFDECEGQHYCTTARCADTCEGYEAYCQRVSDGTGECALRINHHKSLTVV